MASNQVDEALSQAEDEIGPAVLSLSEDQWFDRKSIRVHPRELAKTLIAMGNAEGGVVVIGVCNGEVEGIRHHTDKVNALRQTSIDFTAPPVRARFAQVRCINSAGETDTIGVIRVEPGERVHERTDGECYMRVGDESRKMSFAQRQELTYDRGQSHFDGLRLAGATMEELDEVLLENYKTRAGGSRTAREVLLARHLITSHGEVTNAGYLLFALDPQHQFPQAYIRVIRYLSPERGTGRRQNVDADADIRIEKAIPWLIQEAAAEIDRLAPKRRVLVPGGTTFEDHPLVPRDAWLEGLVNAVIHRSYSLGGDHIRVEIFPDRIEIESPGRFPGLADFRNPLHISRYARNPRIARVCTDLRIGQELGEGIKRIFEEMRQAGLTDPIYQQTSGSVRLTLSATPSIPVSIAKQLPDRSQDVLNALRSADTPLGTGDVASLLRFSRPAVLLRLRALEHTGYIRWVGKSPKDPRAVWVMAVPGQH